ncbi:MAG: hypothetical protein JWM86_2248 [Thermoleophilia bacterium]|nr:hypothetical protein [Thermoleophilia bacterium]
MKLAGAAVLGVGIAATLSACAGRGSTPSQGGGPMGELTDELMTQLHPEAFRGARQLRLDSESIRTVRDGDRLRGSFDGTRLLQAADAHAYGEPTIADPAADRLGDGIATFNEIRHVVRHFDGDGSLAFSGTENHAFQDAVGIRWISA